MIHQIGDFVLRESIRFMSKCDLQKYGLEYIEINMSAAQFMEVSLPDKVDQFLKQYNVPPSQINLEITETEEVYNAELFAQNMARLTQMGISLSLDDYGTGYSNLRRCVSLPLRIVKIDKSLVDDMNVPSVWAAIRDTVSLMQGNGRAIVAEGVETEEGVRRLNSINCDYIQGYYFSKPLPQDEFCAFIRKQYELRSA